MSRTDNPMSFHPIPDRDLDHILRHTEPLWPLLRNARLFITGGTGFFGVWMLESLAQANTLLELDVRATVLSRNPDRFRENHPTLGGNPMYDWLRGDVTDFVFPGGTFTHIIHAATDVDAGLNADAPLVMLNTIIHGTRRVLDFSARCGARDLLFTSSGAVYGRQPPQMLGIPEEFSGGPDVSDPNSAYAEGKRTAELLCAIHTRSSGVRTKIARCFAFVGPHLPMDRHLAVGNFLGDAAAGREITVAGDGRPYRSYLHAADLAIWLWTILLHGMPGRPYNVGSEEAVSIRELAARVATFSPYPRQRIRVLSPEGEGPAARYVPSTARAEAELGLRCFIPLDDAIDRTLAWIMK